MKKIDSFIALLGLLKLAVQKPILMDNVHIPLYNHTPIIITINYRKDPLTMDL